ncbi:MAG: adenylate/guanylate cyclase domain-containing protein [Elusimicrobia bacterium]|nr:adenylate/guanylate cyclase domain-containing protein [Candidatus Obscuribacterium magneticum]
MWKNHNVRSFLICLGLTLLVLLAYLRTGWLDALELKAIDFRFQWRGNRVINPDIAVIEIDEKSIDQLGRWPWKREQHGRLLEILKKAGAKVVAFDTLFTEKDLENRESDLALARVVKEVGNVVSAFFFKGGIQEAMGLDPLYPYEPLYSNGRVGFVNLDPDTDGVTRRAALFAFEKVKEGEVRIRPSLAVAALALSRHQSLEELLPDLPATIDKEDLNLSQNRLFINFAFDQKSPTGYAYPIYSYVDVIKGAVDAAKLFKGKMIFVGATAAALYDLKAIPFVSIHPGVMVHANVVDNLINRNFIREAPVELTLLCVLLMGLFFGLVLPQIKPWSKLGIFAAAVAGWLGLSLWLFASKNYVLPLVPPLVTAVGCYGGVIFYRLLIEEREKRKIKGSFKQYLSPKIIDIITKDPAKLKLGGEEREVSIFFLDIAGFTTMSEALKPAQLVEVMNQCLTVFSGLIFKYEGLINKYIGDCIMAFWNAPIDQPGHAGQACLAALGCINALPDLNRQLESRGLPRIDCRVGINTGVVVVGNMGSNERFDYTVMGDAVNLASRLEGANKEYHSHAMISDVTFQQASGEIEARDLDLIRVKGKKEPRKVFELLCKKGEMSEELREGRDVYHKGLGFYRRRNFPEALKCFEQVFATLPDDHITKVYLDRTQAFIKNPPPDTWDGVFEMTHK